MALRINDSSAAFFINAQLRKSFQSTASSLVKLSSGKRINRAADDASGMAIADSLKSQALGIGQAIRNANDGIALLQIAEGALNEVSSILQRMRELSIQSANDTLTSVERDSTSK